MDNGFDYYMCPNCGYIGPYNAEYYSYSIRMSCPECKEKYLTHNLKKLSELEIKILSQMEKRERI